MSKGHFTTCCSCKSKLWLPEALYEAAMAGREKISFFCAYGHGQHFLTGESDEVRLRRERDRLRQENARLAEVAEVNRRGWAEADKLAKNLKRQRAATAKRAANGVCPCCSRTFQNVGAHMKNKHPTYLAEQTTGIAQ